MNCAFIRFIKKKLPNWRFTSAFLLSGTLAACSVPSPPFGDMATEYQNTVEQYNFNNILLNIVRGSINLPLSFLDIPSIIGTGNFGAGASGTFGSASVTSSLLSSPLNYFSVMPNFTVGRSFNYTQSSLDNATFQAGFNSTIPLSTLNFFKSANMPPELLVNLFVGSVDLVQADGTVQRYVNIPGLESYDKFQVMAKLFVKYNLTTQVTHTEVPVGPKLSDAQAAATLPSYLANGKVQLKYFPSTGKEKSYYQLVSVAENTSLCLGESAFKKEISERYGDSYFCSKPVANPFEQAKHTGISSVNNRAKGKASISINIRSNRDIYQYLGQVLIVQASNPNDQVKIEPTYVVTGQKPKPLPLLVVKKNDSVDNYLARVNYRGDTYSIPMEDNGYTPLVINVMAQLLNLNKVSGSIPLSPAVIVK
jgi:hypothetical protein